MRPARAENAALQEIFARPGAGPPRNVLGLGIEFPSDRMLRHAGKGVDKEEILESLRICGANGVAVNGNVVLGWNNLREEDLRELEDFLERMPEGAMTSMQVRWLFAHPHTEVHATYTGEPIRLGPFYVGFRAEIGPGQTLLNRAAGELLERYSRRKHYRVEGLSYIRNTLQKI
jgi:radical SAM superfamily enzyme YgiQ (UPF0313 family)